MPTPPWVAKSLADILGLDTETIREMIIPDLEGYTSEVRLRGHLQDFLGSATEARAFSDRYVSYRFPSLATTAKPAQLTPDPDLAKPKKTKSKSLKASTSGSASGSGRGTPGRLTPTPSIPEQLNAAFGPGGKVYQKKMDDEVLFAPSRGGSGSGVHRAHAHAHTPAQHSQPASGTQTPVRRGGAITITEVKAKPAATSKGKAKEEKIWDLPKSKEVKRLEKIVEDLRGVQGDGKGSVSDKPPCFCQARVHPLATYTPQCAACGLILCDLQAPHAPCPSCARPTLSPPALARLIQRVEGDIAAQLALEQDERDEAERQRKEKLLIASGGGAFPSLPGQQPAKPSSADVTRRVLTINKPSKGKGKATLTTTTYTPAAPSSSKAKVEEEAVETIPRPRSPPLDAHRAAKELAKALAWRTENDRPWADPKAERRGEMYEYIPPLVIELPNEEGTGRRRKAKQKKGVGMDGRVVVGAR